MSKFFRFRKLLIGAIAMVAMFSFGLEVVYAATGTIDNTDKYSQFLDIDLDNDSTDDFINWLPTNATNPVSVTDTTITGDIWGESVGWINLNPDQAGVTNTCDGELGGYAWGENTGWINFETTNATIDPNIDTATGEITGQVWSQNYGWIELASPDGTYHGLVTNWTPSSSCGPGPQSSPTLRVIKNVDNTNGGGKQPTDFMIGLYIGNNLVPVGTPMPGVGGAGRTYTNIVSGKYRFIETPVAGYTASFSGACDQSGQVFFPSGFTGQLTCTITNTYQSVPPIDACLNLNWNVPIDQVPSGYYAVNRYCYRTVFPRFGCRDSTANNYDPMATASDGSCQYDSPPLEGCTNPNATNYDPDAVRDDGSCEFIGDPIGGCTDSLATNYNAQATYDDGSCEFDELTEIFTDWFGGNIPPWILTLIGLIGLLSSIPGLITRFGNLILTFVFARKKPRGIVYDAVTKEPLDPAYVRVFDNETGMEIGNQFTDLEGRYGFILKQGTYHIIVNKTHYEFPSKLLAGKISDEVYDNLYFGEAFAVGEKENVTAMNIPMDPIATDWNQVEKRRMNPLRTLIRNQTIFGWLFNILFAVGFAASILITWYYPVWWNIVMTSLYVVVAALQAYGMGPVTIGTITKNGTALPYAIVRVYNAALGHEVARKVTTELGGYYILVPKSDYYITIEEKRPDGTYAKIYSSGVMRAYQGLINKSFNIT